jgi:flavin-dependent dehydrogenase
MAMGFSLPCFVQTQDLMTAHIHTNTQTNNLQTAINDQYEVAIVGGGLAGLSLAIQLRKAHHPVVLFEKEQYPFHRVCGEYISMESWDFLTGLGVPLEQMNVPRITELQVSSCKGRVLNHQLPLGGFGISRYLLDSTLYKIAKNAGVTIMENTRVTNISFDKGKHLVETSHGNYRADIACGSFGKRSNLDVKWKRPFVARAKNKLNNFIGVKYHVQADCPVNTIALHLFPNGYCGVVKIENDLLNLCYLTTAANLQEAGGSIAEMENRILTKNPHLLPLLQDARINETPLTISQISFDAKEQVYDHVLLTGDAAGMITPLCGNGMSMGLHASKLLANRIPLFLSGAISRLELERAYRSDWQSEFGQRLRTGRLIQKMFANEWLTNLAIKTLTHFPTLGDRLIRLTHGKRF